MKLMRTDEIYIVPLEYEFVRLDKVLAEVLPDSGLRLRRRLCDDGKVLVDDKVRSPGYKVRAEQIVKIIRENENMSAEEMGLRVVKREELFGAVFKPGGIHSAAIAGKDEPSVESVLEDLFPGVQPILLNRLDNLTSGLLLVAMSDEGKQVYHDMENAGEIKKFYIATVHGRLDGMVTVRNKLDTDDRKTTKVLDDDDEDVRRWTDVEVISHDHQRDTSEVRCLIMKGARHQIRAHLASIGHPIVGDPIYGRNEDGPLELMHQQIQFSGFSAEVGEVA